MNRDHLPLILALVALVVNPYVITIVDRSSRPTIAPPQATTGMDLFGMAAVTGMFVSPIIALAAVVLGALRSRKGGRIRPFALIGAVLGILLLVAGMLAWSSLLDASRHVLN